MVGHHVLVLVQMLITYFIHHLPEVVKKKKKVPRIVYEEVTDGKKIFQ